MASLFMDNDGQIIKHSMCDAPNAASTGCLGYNPSTPWMGFNSSQEADQFMVTRPLGRIPTSGYDHNNMSNDRGTIVDQENRLPPAQPLARAA